MIVLQQIFIGMKAGTEGLVSSILGLISIYVALIALVYAVRAGQSSKPR